MPIPDNDKPLITNSIAAILAGTLQDAIEEEKRLVNEQLRRGVVIKTWREYRDSA